MPISTLGTIAVLVLFLLTVATACLGVLEQLVADGHIGRDDQVVVFNMGAVQKYVEVMSEPAGSLDCRHPVDWVAAKSRGAQ